ncbi:hypothetical protein J1605_006499 [Eschrichtius robustus]|uniref:Uncharacterized protein n=1 Tax=Eschrichtius robustus TaxID=9764 RepID=A0AB34H3K0_ESCRO|nr:hypothetical protein J1605_006499 [Eschrichtius robustus]
MLRVLSYGVGGIPRKEAAAGNPQSGDLETWCLIQALPDEKSTGLWVHSVWLSCKTARLDLEMVVPSPGNLALQANPKPCPQGSAEDAVVRRWGIPRKEAAGGNPESGDLDTSRRVHRALGALGLVELYDGRPGSGDGGPIPREAGSAGVDAGAPVERRAVDGDGGRDRLRGRGGPKFGSENWTGLRGCGTGKGTQGWACLRGWARLLSETGRAGRAGDSYSREDTSSRAVMPLPHHLYAAWLS